MIRESARRCVSLSAPLFFPLDCAVRQSSTVLLPPLSLVNLCSGSIDVQFQAPDICDIAVAIPSLIFKSTGYEPAAWKSRGVIQSLLWIGGQDSGFGSFN